MKFISNPDKYIFFIGISMIGIVSIFAYMMLNQLLVMLPLLILWIAFSFFMIKRNYIVYAIKDTKFIIKYFKTTFEISFNEINYIIQVSNYINLLAEKKYEIVLRGNINVPKRLLKIENNFFTKWLLKNQNKFKIIKKTIL